MSSPDNRPEKYFLCFGFENFSAKDLKKFHVTLIFVGQMSNEKLKDLIKVVDEFFRQGCYSDFPTLKFSKEDFFGPEKTIRVLLPTELCFNADMFKEQFQVLRDRTEKFQEREDFPFNPHLTTDLHYFRGTIDKLYLCGRGYRVVQSWTL